MLVITDSFLYLHSRPLPSLQFPVLAAPALKRRARNQGSFWIPPSPSITSNLPPRPVLVLLEVPLLWPSAQAA